MSTCKEIFVEETGKLLDHHQVLVNIICGRRIMRMVEVGVHKGKLTRNVLRSSASQIIREYYAVDQWKDDPDYWSGLDQQHWDGIYASAIKYVPWFQQLRIIKLDSVSASKLFWDGFFDLVYIDGDHRYDSVIADLKAWLPKVRKGGLLMGHDYVDRVRSNHQVKPAVNDFFGGEDEIIREKSCIWVKEL